jgi:natural product precursor
MKKLNKLQVNPERIMKEEELVALRGGYSWLTCRVDGVICWSATIDSCIYAYSVCSDLCGPWTEAICGGD